MKHTTKIISSLLALVLCLSVAIVPVGAADVEAGTVDVTFSVEKHEGVDSLGAPAEDIYAVTMYLKNTNPINALLVPVYYNKTLFTPVDGTDMSILEWGYTVDFENGLTGVAYLPGTDLSDTRKFTNTLAAPGDRVVNARGAVNGLGHTSAQKVLDIIACNPETTTLTHFWGGLSKDTYGAIYINYETGNMTCNLQAYNEPTPYVTMLFKLNPGVTDADVVGAEFGYLPASTKPYDGTTEADLTKFFFSAQSTGVTPTFNASYCVVESSTATPVVAKAKSQVLFTGDKATGTPDDAFAYRLTSVVTADDLALMNANGNTITELGFVAANASNAGTLAEAKAAVEAGTQLPAGWKTANTTYISQADASADAYFGARIQNILHSTQTEDISVCAYVAYTNGNTTSYIWYDAAVTAGVSTNYDSAVAAWAKL